MSATAGLPTPCVYSSTAGVSKHDSSPVGPLQHGKRLTRGEWGLVVFDERTLIGATEKLHLQMSLSLLSGIGSIEYLARREFTSL